jgi:uncharacterized membrane protein
MTPAFNEELIKPSHGRTSENTTATRFEDFARELAQAYKAMGALRMIDKLNFVLMFVSALGSGLIAGFFLAFSIVVMKALGQQPPSHGIAAMQSINLVVLNPMFFTAFFGTAATCLVLLVLTFFRWHRPGAAYLLTGSLLYGTVQPVAGGLCPELADHFKQVR